MRRATLASMLIGAGGLLVSSCYDVPDQTLHFTADFVLMGEKNQPVKDMSFLVGQTIEWCNTTEYIVVVTTSDRKVFGGRNSFRLPPGECVHIRVGKTNGDFTIHWTYMNQDGGVEGEGGNPGRVDCPPPPQPC